MRSSRSALCTSSWAQLNGRFNFDRHPLAVPGTAVVAHEMPTQRDSYGPHGKRAFYLGTSFEHYRCHRVWITELRSVRVVSTMAWHPIPYYMSGASLHETLETAITSLVTIIQQCMVSPAAVAESSQPLAVLEPTALAQLLRLRDLFQHATPSSAVSGRTSDYPPPPGLIRRQVEQRAPEQRVPAPTRSVEDGIAPVATSLHGCISCVPLAEHDNGLVSIQTPDLASDILSTASSELRTG